MKVRQKLQMNAIFNKGDYVKHYLVEIFGIGEKCGSKVGCGKEIKTYEAESEEQVVSQILHDYGHDVFTDGDVIPVIEKMNIYEVGKDYKTFMNLPKFYKAQNERYKLSKKDQQDT